MPQDFMNPTDRGGAYREAIAGPASEDARRTEL